MNPSRAIRADRRARRLGALALAIGGLAGGCGTTGATGEPPVVVGIAQGQQLHDGGQSFATSAIGWARRPRPSIDPAWQLALRGVTAEPARPVAEIEAAIIQRSQHTPKLPPPFAQLMQDALGHHYAELAHGYRAAGMDRQADQASDQALVIYRALLVQPPPQHGAAAHQLAQLHLAQELERRGQWDEAERAYRAFLDAAKADDAVPLAAVAVAEAQLGGQRLGPDDRQRVFELYDRAAGYANSPVRGLASCRLGDIQLERKDYEAALATYRQALDHCVRHPRAPFARPLADVIRSGLVEAYGHVGKPEQAYQDFRERNPIGSSGGQATLRMLGRLAWQYRDNGRVPDLVRMLRAALPLALEAKEPAICQLTAAVLQALQEQPQEPRTAAAVEALSREHQAGCRESVGAGVPMGAR